MDDSAEDLEREAGRRLVAWADGDESPVLADDLEDLADRLVRAGTRALAEMDDADTADRRPLRLLIDAALLYQHRAISLARAGNRERSRALLKHAGFVGLTVALRKEDVPVQLGPAVALAASSWSTELVNQVGAGGGQELLDEAVESARLATELADRRRPGAWRTLAAALAMRYERSGSADDLDEAVAIFRQLAAPADGSPPPAVDLHNLGVVLRTRADFRGVVADLDEATDALTRALAGADEDRVADYATSLAAAHTARFELSGAPEDVRAAVAALRLAVARTGTDDPAMAVRASALGTALRAAYDLGGAPDVLDEAVLSHRRASEAVTPDRPEAPGIWMNHGNALRTLFELTGDVADLTAAIDLTTRAAGALPGGAPGRARLLSNLGAMLRLRFQHLGSPEDLTAAIDTHVLATGLADPADTHWPRYSANLSAALVSRYDLTGDTADLDRAVDVARRAVVGSGGPADRARCLSTLANALMARFERLHAYADLNEVIRVMRSAVALLPAGHVDRAGYLTNLGIALQGRFARAEAREDLDEAVAAAREALAESGGNSPARRTRTSNLAGALLLVFKSTGDPAALDSAIELLRTGVEATPADDPGLGLRRSNLGLALLHRFERTRDPADLRDAVHHTDAALGTGATGPLTTIGPATARSLINAGSAQQALGLSEADDLSLDRATAAWRTVSSAPAAVTADRVVAAAAWGRLSALRRRWSEAADAYGLALTVLDTMAWRGVSRPDNEYVLGGWHDVARDAAACTVAAGRAADALRLLDSGRGVLWARQLDLGADLDELERRQPSLARSLRRVRSALNAT